MPHSQGMESVRLASPAMAATSTIVGSRVNRSIMNHSRLKASPSSPRPARSMMLIRAISLRRWKQAHIKCNTDLNEILPEEQLKLLIALEIGQAQVGIKYAKEKHAQHVGQVDKGDQDAGDLGAHKEECNAHDDGRWLGVLRQQNPAHGPKAQENGQ